MKSKLTPALLAECLAEMRSGRLSVDHCLAAHPAVANELRPLLETALALSAPPAVRPDASFRVRGRLALMNSISAPKGAATEAPRWRFWHAIAGRQAPRARGLDVSNAVTETAPLAAPAEAPDREGRGPRDKPVVTATVSPAITTTSPTFAVTLTHAISDVNNLARDPKVPGQGFNGLMAKLHGARAALGRGHDQVAVHQLGAFLNELNAMRRSGHISPEDYDKLFAEYASLVAGLGGAPGSQVPPRADRKPEKPRPEGSGRPSTSPSPEPTPVVTPTQTLTSTRSSPEPKNPRPVPGKPEDTPRRPAPGAVPTQKPPAATPSPEKEKPERQTPEGRSGDRSNDGPDRPEKGVVPAQPARPPETVPARPADPPAAVPARPAQPPSPTADSPSQRSDRPGRDVEVQPESTRLRTLRP